MNPRKMADKVDAIIVFSDGAVALNNGLEGAAAFRSTTYEERDAAGTLGGYVRAEAGALLSKKFPEAFMVATSKRGGESVTHAQIIAHELETYGVSRERIILEECSENTLEQIVESLAIAKEKGWSSAVFVSNEYHMPRIQAFCEHVVHPSIAIEYVSAESVISENDPKFAARFEEIKKTDAYQTRLASEQKGVDAIEKGEYRLAGPGDKKAL